MKRLFPSLPADATLASVYRSFPEKLSPWCEYESQIMRGESELTVAERELIAAYVSGLNACTYCHEAHTVFARAYGIDAEVIDALMLDLKAAPIDSRLKPILAYVETLTLSPSRMTEADAQAVYDAGWSERALFDAIQVCCVFNFVNRLVEGTGISFDGGEASAVSDDDLAELRSDTFYTDFARENGVKI
ncbi:carboxymuconolactone decarboxylase family protein [Nioella sp.]|uniref:carboxymuconolactone decarboxylase family protein n=1 Tax=Nioella sp. TaxID=1912091 RepID=UPI003B52F091